MEDGVVVQQLYIAWLQHACQPQLLTVSQLVHEGHSLMVCPRQTWDFWEALTSNVVVAAVVETQVALLQHRLS